MLIRVMYDDGSSGMVKPYLLDRLLEQKKVVSFLRSEGWVFVGRDTLRSLCRSQCYDGEENRNYKALSASSGRNSVMHSLTEFAWIAGLLVFISVMFTRFL